MSRCLLPHSSTFSWKNLVLLLLLSLFCGGHSSWSSPKAKGLPTRRERPSKQEKPGKCPKERLKCTSWTSSCNTDFDCQDYLKCCRFNCMRTCLDPYTEPCLLPPKPGHCQDTQKRYYYNSRYRVCLPFSYGGCDGNINRFTSRWRCHKACLPAFRKEQCPLFPMDSNRMECPDTCISDYDCPRAEKCCESTCGFVCVMAWKVKGGLCPPMPEDCLKIDQPKCQQDYNCKGRDKCCSTCGLKCLSPL